MKRPVLSLSMGVILVAAVATACSSGGGDGGPATASSRTSALPSASPTIITVPSATIAVGTGELPSGFPDSFPLPDGATPVNSVSVAGGSFVWFASDRSVEDLRSFFDENLSKDGWKIDNKADITGPDGEYTFYLIKGNGSTGGVYIGAGAPGSDAYTGQYAFYVALSPA